MAEPGKHPGVTILQNDLGSLLKAMSIGADDQGLIEIIGIGNGDSILCNVEGKLIVQGSCVAKVVKCDPQ